MVESAEGMRIGRVVELHYGSRLDQPDELAVQAGRFGLRLLVYPAEAVKSIHPGEQRLILTRVQPRPRAGAAAAATPRPELGYAPQPRGAA